MVIQNIIFQLEFCNFSLDLGGKNEWEEAKAMEISCLCDEMAYVVGPYVGAKLGFRQGDVVSLIIMYIFF